ncbi:flavin-containing monooxygenase [Sphingomonas sp. CFBP 8760]|uniref:flavin-containing monooxygenase n=1 Tax=Sphingomonas sp. CFBP 8760 TaxID=2775282 RepID=UPI003144F610
METSSTTLPGHVDVLIVGAGISGISAAYHLRTRCPDSSWLILETRDAIGGTWDLFRYPGVRSDSDMHTLGFSFQPWTGEKSIADGASIRDYVQKTAHDHGIDRHIRFGMTVTAASWCGDTARWRIEGEGPDGPFVLTASFVDLCAGYYDYDGGHAPEFAGADVFAGRIVHPQHWPADLDHRGRRVVVIGSGATAVTLVPALAGDAGHVTMLQRSPSYVVAMPAVDAIAARLRRWLPTRSAYAVIRAKNIAFGMATFALARRLPTRVAHRIVAAAQKAIGPAHDAGVHFTPRYRPWDQRVCLSPDGDLFAALREGRASIVTDSIDRLIPEGVRLASGATIPADLIVTATGLRVKMAGGIAFRVDGHPIGFAGRLLYRGMMFEGVPNLIHTFGYTNASWTLKADLTAAYLCRLLRRMQRTGARSVVPVNSDESMAIRPFVSFSSGYITRAADDLPVQGERSPWRLRQNYLLDMMTLQHGTLRNNARSGLRFMR